MLLALASLGLVTIFYRLRSETSLFVASYDLQVHGGGIRARLHTGSHPTSQSYITTDGQSASLSWCQAPIWALRPDFYYCQTVAGLLMWGALSQSESESHCDWRPVSLFILVSCPVWGSWPDVRYCLTVTVLSLGGRPLWREDGSVVCQSAVLGQLSVCTIFTFYMCHMLLNTYTIYTRPYFW
jgi:hypothetical protein